MKAEVALASAVALMMFYAGGVMTMAIVLVSTDGHPGILWFSPVAAGLLLWSAHLARTAWRMHKAD